MQRIKIFLSKLVEYKTNCQKNTASRKKNVEKKKKKNKTRRQNLMF